MPDKTVKITRDVVKELARVRQIRQFWRLKRCEFEATGKRSASGRRNCVILNMVCGIEDIGTCSTRDSAMKKHSGSEKR